MRDATVASGSFRAWAKDFSDALLTGATLTSILCFGGVFMLVGYQISISAVKSKRKSKGSRWFVCAQYANKQAPAGFLEKLGNKSEDCCYCKRYAESQPSTHL